jgi:hypothetical protein
LYKIPNLTEKYIYLNDDVLIWNKVEPKTFFEKNKTRETNEKWKFYDTCEYPVKFTDNNIIISDFRANDYDFCKLMVFNQKLISKYLNESLYFIRKCSHVPSGNIKSLNQKLDEFLDTIPFKDTNINEHTKMSKFRKNTNIAQVSIFRKYWYKKYNAIVDSNSKCIYTTISSLNNILINKILHSKCHFLCVNSTADYNDNDCKKQVSLLKLLFESKFPFPSSFEKTLKTCRNSKVNYL